MLNRVIRKLLKSEKGAAGLEFALILPAMLFIYLGGSYVSSLASLNKKLQTASYAVNNLVPYPRDYCSYRAFARNFYATGGAKQVMGEFLAPYSVGDQPMMIQYTESAPDVDNLVTVKATARYSFNTGFWGVVNSVAANTPGATGSSGLVPSVFSLSVSSPGVTVKKNPSTTCPTGILKLIGPAVTEFAVGEHNSFTVRAEEGIPPYQITLASALPPDLTFATDGMQADVSGAIPETCTTGPCNPETINVTLAAEDASGSLFGGSGNVSTQKTFQINLIHSLRLSVQSEVGTVNTFFQSAAPARQGGKPGYTFSITNKPPGLDINPTTGIVSGTPAAPGVYEDVVITVRDARGSTVSDDKMVYNIKPPGLTAYVDGSFNGTAGVNHAVGIHARGGWGVITVACSGFPAGLGCGPASKATPYDGAVSGAASQLGNGTGTITFRDAANQVATVTMAWSIQPPALNARVVSAMGGQAGTYVRGDVGASGGWGSLWVVSVTGAPSGIGPAHVGYWQWALHGTAPYPGAGHITVVIGDQANQRATVYLPYNYSAPPLSTGKTGDMVGLVCCTTSYSRSVTAYGGWGGLSWSWGPPPPGMTISAGGNTATISGKPSAATGRSSTRITVTDAAGQSSFQDIIWDFEPADPPLKASLSGQGNSYCNGSNGCMPYGTLRISGGDGPYKVTVPSGYEAFNVGGTNTQDFRVSSVNYIKKGTTFKVTARDEDGVTETFTLTWNHY